MKNLFTLLIIFFIIGFSIRKGIVLQKQTPPPSLPPPQSSVPFIGRIEVLNGCGSAGSARIIADYLRKKHFDVKNIGNASSWNFPETLVISRISTTSIAKRVAAALGTKNILLIRTPENLYDVTVIIGPDCRNRFQ